MRKQKLCKSPLFKRLISILIFLYAAMMGIETYFHPTYSGVFAWIDGVFTIFFSVELILRIQESRSFFDFFRIVRFHPRKGTAIVLEDGFWNVFDFLLIALSVFGFISLLLDDVWFLVYAPLFRVVRILRLLEVSQGLRKVENRIVSIMPTVVTFAGLVAVLLYVYSIIGMHLFEFKSFQHADFSSLDSAYITLFQVMTLDNWVDVMTSVSDAYEGSWLVKSYFISFVLLTAIICFNVFIAILTGKVQEKLQEDNKKRDENFQKEMEESDKDLRDNLKLIIKELNQVKAELRELKDKK